MVGSDKSGVNEQLAALQAEFKQQLPESIAEIKQQWSHLCQGETSREAIVALHMLVHGLTATSGVFGAVGVSALSAEIERSLKQEVVDSPQVDSTMQQKIDALLTQLDHASEKWQPGTIHFTSPVSTVDSYSQGGELICMIEDDMRLVQDITAELNKTDYRVQHFVSLDDFVAVRDDIRPDVILMGLLFEGSDVDKAARINALNAEYCSCPVICISSRSDMEARLTATRAGAMRYLTKPLNTEKLVQTLDNLFSRLPEEPYRILLIDDDEVLLNYYAAVLRESGMSVAVAINPFDCLEVLERFKPDLILLDVYMPECSGLELAQVIRQDDAWAQTPIVFLSTEPDIDRQLLALNLGGDDFLNKSVDPRQLLKSVFARAKRSRTASVMQRGLQKAMRESEFKNITLDRHAIVSITDVTGRITHANEQFCEISGYSCEELLGQNHRLLRSGRHKNQFYKDMWKKIANGEIWHGSICNRAKNGEEYWVESTIVPFLNEHGKPYQYVAARTDVTQMRVNEDRLNRSQTFANIGTWDWNIQTGSLYWSERIAPLFGYSEGELEHTHDNFLQGVHPDDRQYVTDSANNCVEHGTKYDIEHRVVWPDGTVRWVQERGDVVRDEESDIPMHMLGVVQDITPRKEAEYALRESEQRLKMAQQIGKIGNWSWDLANEKIYWSDQTYKIFGYRPGEFQPNYARFLEAVHPDDVERIKASMRSALEESKKHSSDHRIVLKDGQIRWVHAEAESVKNDIGQVVAIHGIVQNISDRIWNEQLQKGNNYILELIAEDKPLEDILSALVLHAEKMLPGVIGSILLLDESGQLLRHGAAPSLPDFYNEAIDGLEIGPEVGACGAAVYSGEPVIIRDTQTHPSWDAFRELSNKAGLGACWALPVLASNGGVLGTFAMYYTEARDPDDISLELAAKLANLAAIAIEQKRSRKALVDAKQEAEYANSAKSQFLSSMSHELRTPMNAIIGFAQLLQIDNDELNEIQRDNVGEIISASKHLLELINEVLDLAKIESGHIDLRMETVSVNVAINECLSLLTPLAEKRGIDISLMCNCNAEQASLTEASQSHLEVYADRTRLKQVLFNLLSNAVKYNEEKGQINISCSQSEKDRVRISVRDTGCGIAQENLPQLFKAFSRLGAEDSEVEGTGIGLVITRRIVELMDGSIGVESQPGEGSTFWIELPCGNEPVAVKEKEQSQQDQKSVELKTDGHEYTLLYVEDNPANLRLVEQLLARRPNIKMLSAEEPILGLELAAEHKPDLILLDINLPGMDGFGVLEHLRSRQDTSETPIIAISANAMPSDIEMGLDAGFDHYITKPIDAMVFLSIIDEALISISEGLIK